MKYNNIVAIYFVFFLVILLFIGEVHGAPYSEVKIVDNITQTSLAYSYSYVNYNIAVYNLTASKLNISLPINIKNLNITSTQNVNISQKVYPNSDCHTFSTSIGCKIVELSGIKNGEKFNITYNYYQNYSGTSDSFNSTIYFMPSSFVSSLNITMILPKGSYLPSNEYNEPTISSIIPKNGLFYIKWKFIDQSYPNVTGYYIALPFTINYNLKLNYKKPISYNDNYLLILVIIIAIIIALAYIYTHKILKKHINRPISKKDKRNAKSIIYNILSTDEKKILNTIDKNKFIYQSDIIKKTGFSKVKISKVLSKLYRYKLIKIKQDGRTNRIKRV